MSQLLAVARNVLNLATTQKFYCDALGFVAVGPVHEDAVLAEALGVAAVKKVRLRIGKQILDLTECTPAGLSYPVIASADDIFFQHIAIVTTDIFTVFQRAMNAGAKPISSGGPAQLPEKSGGVRAWKFRDPDGHPLEFVQFPNVEKWCGSDLYLGYDHTAISVADAGRAIAFYTALGLQLQHQQINQGPEQDQLDGLRNSVLDVIALAPQAAPPHLELLSYHRTSPKPSVEIHPNDIAADRLVFGNTSGKMTINHDPDGHFLLLDGRETQINGSF